MPSFDDIRKLIEEGRLIGTIPTIGIDVARKDNDVTVTTTNSQLKHIPEFLMINAITSNTEQLDGGYKVTLKNGYGAALKQTTPYTTTIFHIVAESISLGDLTGQRFDVNTLMVRGDIFHEINNRYTDAERELHIKEQLIKDLTAQIKEKQELIDELNRYLGD